MDPHLQYLKAAIAVGLEGKETETQIGFNLAVLLDPSSVSMPLHVAESRAQFETGEIPRLWTEAMKRSAALEKLDPLVFHNQRNTFALIMSLCAKYPELTSEAVKLAADRPESPLLLKTWATSANRFSLDTIMPELLAAPDLPAWQRIARRSSPRNSLVPLRFADCENRALHWQTYRQRRCSPR